MPVSEFLGNTLYNLQGISAWGGRASPEQCALARADLDCLSAWTEDEFWPVLQQRLDPLPTQVETLRTLWDCIGRVVAKSVSCCTVPCFTIQLSSPGPLKKRSLYSTLPLEVSCL